MIGKMWKIERK